MRESFDEYKSTIESNVINFTYLYDGDVISSKNESYAEIVNHGRTSPIPIINCISDIYNKSIQMMMDKSIEKVIGVKNIINIPGDKADNIFYYINQLKNDVKNYKPLYIFCSENSRKLFGITKKVSTNKPFPYYLYDIHKYHSMSYDLYLSPLIDDNEDEFHVYVTDRSIQSLVYSIQNMEYDIVKIGDDYKHTIYYKLYDCDFTCYKLVIKDISRMREDKINQLLNDN